MEILTNPDAWIALLTLTFLEIILGIDNIVFLSIVSGKLEEKDQPKARRIGLLLAMAFRVVLLFGITWVMSLKKSFYDFDLGFFLLTRTMITDCQVGVRFPAPTCHRRVRQLK